MSLLERESSLASLSEYAADARAGEGRLVLVSGEAGVGKSTLVEHLQHDLPDSRWTWGGCDGLFIPRPLGPLFDLASQLGGDLLDLTRSHAAREDLFGALLRQLNEPGALNVVVVEDAHWADEATIDLLRFLGRRVRSCEALVIVTYRDDAMAANHPLRLALGELATHRSTRRIGLAPLSEGAVRVLAGGTGLSASELYRLTSGNPFYVTEVIQAGTGDVPPSARDAVLARVTRLSDPSRTVLNAAALIGTRIDLPLLESVTRCPPSVVDELLASGLLVGDTTSLRFRHEIARLAVEQALGAHRHVLVHARILASLRSLGCGDGAQLAFHADGAGDAAAVLEYAPAAARHASELGSHREAAAQYERALRSSAGGQPAVVAGLCDGLSHEMSLLDRWQDAADTCERALALWRQLGDRASESRRLRLLSCAMWRMCRGNEALSAAASAVTTVEPLGPSVELAWAYAGLAGQEMMRGEHAAAIEHAQRAQRIAEPLGASEVMSDALDTEACSLAAMDREWTPRLRRALEIAVSAGHDEQAGRAFSNLFSVLCAEQRFAEAERYFVDGVAYCDEHDITTFATCLRGERVSSLEKTGRWDDAVALSIELLDRAAASPVNRLCPLAMLGIIRVRRGEPGGWACLDDAMALAEATEQPQQIVPLRLARAEAYWLDGKPDLARVEAELAADVCGSLDRWERGAVAGWLRRVGSTRSVQGELAEPFQRMLGGDAKAAAQAWVGLGSAYQAALALSDTDDAPLLREAVTTFSQLGATAAARLTQQKMRLLGIRSIPTGARASTRSHPLGLTRREREVLDRVCEGLTNAEIGTRLFISAKTVDHHVSAVLAKLGAPTRSAAASEARRLGLVPAVAAAGPAR